MGYVHAIAHTLGGFYHTPHGLANSVILPEVLEFYGDAVYKKLARLADIVGINADTEEAKAKAFVKAIRDMNRDMDIPDKFVGVIKDEDIPLMVERAYAEAHPLYPVPKFMSKKDLADMYAKLKG